MNIEDLVELAKQVCHNVDLNLTNKELWRVLGERSDDHTIPLKFKTDVHAISWAIAKIERQHGENKNEQV